MRRILIENIEDLKIELEKILSTNYLILCLGNRLRADDAAGILIGEKIKEGYPKNKSIIIAENSPVNFIGKISKIHPSTLLIIDAVEFGLSPGTITLSDEKIIANTNSTTTHYQDLEDLLKFLELEGKKPDLCIILGIQVEKITLFQSVSEAVINSVNKVSQAIVELLG